MWRAIVAVINAVRQQVVYSENDIANVQAALSNIMRAMPRYIPGAVGKNGQLEMYDLWTGEHGVLLDCGAWLPGAWIASDGSTNGPIDATDTWSGC